jgi:hypothetical protein
MTTNNDSIIRRLADARACLASADNQSTPSDDAIIMEHVRTAITQLDSVLADLRSAKPDRCTSCGRQTCEPSGQCIPCQLGPLLERQ